MRFRLPLRVALLLAALSVASVLPFHFLARRAPGAGIWRLRMPMTHDAVSHFDHTKSFYAGLASGRAYPRWDAEINRGFGAPALSFHPSGIYYVMSLVHALFPDWEATFLVTHLLVMALSGAALYLYARRHLSEAAASVAMAAYVVLPYHLIDLYHRGALAEWLGFVWMPLTLLFTERLVEEEGGLLDAAGLALCYGGFLWSHLPTAHQFTMVLALTAGWLALRRGRLLSLAPVAGALVAGLGLAAAYVYPAIVEQAFIRPERVRDVWPYAESYLLVRTPPAQAPPEFWALLNQAWLFGALGTALAGAAFLLHGRSETSRLRERALLWAASGIFLCFMMTSLSAPVSRLVPKLEMTAFAWRMLCGSTLFLALLAGACAEGAAAAGRSGRHSRRRLLAVLAGAIVVGGATFSAVRVAAPRLGAMAFHPREDRTPAENPWVVPKTALDDVKALPLMEPAVVGRGRVEVERWDQERRALRVELPGSDTLRVRTFDFPGWTASLDGRPATIVRGELGEITLALPAGTHRILLDYGPTPARRMGTAATLVSAAAVAAMVVLGLRRKPRPA